MTAVVHGVAAVAAVALGYLSGALPWGLWLGLWVRGIDVRTVGSRNLGATNVYRSLGARLGLLTLLLDIAKGALPVWLVPRMLLGAPSPTVGAAFPGGPEWCAIAVGLAAVAGHVWTCFAAFRGGKGVATTVGVLLALSPPAFGVFVTVFVLTVALSRFISLGSILGSAAFSASLAWLAPGGMTSPTFGVGVLIALLVIARHRENIVRLLHGEERRFSFRSATPR